MLCLCSPPFILAFLRSASLPHLLLLLHLVALLFFIYPFLSFPFILCFADMEAEKARERQKSNARKERKGRKKEQQQQQQHTANNSKTNKNKTSNNHNKQQKTTGQDKNKTHKIARSVPNGLQIAHGSKIGPKCAAPPPPTLLNYKNRHSRG